MMTLAIILAIILIVTGIFFFITATIGLLRFPDVYCRMQATGKGDTMGALLTLMGLALYNFVSNDLTFASALVSIKIMLIAIFILIANPTATYAITKSGIESGLQPLTKEDLKK